MTSVAFGFNGRAYSDINQYLVSLLEVRDSREDGILRYFQGSGEITLCRPTEEKMGIIVLENVDGEIIRSVENIIRGDFD